MPPAPAYRVEDRSVLLPHYKRLLVDPVLAHVPARLSPNAITHVGHLLCLSALLVLWPVPRGWALAASALLLHAYLWCDNADGAHARRTGQASTAGEYLDHGLDLANCVYIGVVSAAAIDRHAQTSGLAIAMIIPCAAAFTVWEQAVTGVFRLGMLNQIESMIFLTGVMVFDAAFGVDVLANVRILGFSMQSWIWLGVFSTVAFGMARGVLRIASAKKSLAPGAALLALVGAVCAAHGLGHLPTPLAYVCAATGIVAFGMRLLRARIAGEGPGHLATLAPAAAAAVLGGATAALPSGMSAVALAVTVGGAGLLAADTLAVARRATAPGPLASERPAPTP